MKKAYLFALFSLVAIASCAAAFAGEVPPPQGRVNDFANVISAEYRSKLEALIAEVEEKTSAEIAVVTVGSIAPYDETSYARMIFDSWKIGKKGKDNGVLVLLAIKERRWRIESGYGVEGALPDGRCGEIGRASMVPYFKTGAYGEGLYRGVAALAGILAQDAKTSLDNLQGVRVAEPHSTNAGKTDAVFTHIVVPLLFFFWSLPWPILIGLPICLFIAFVLSSVSPIMPYLILAGYAASLIFRYVFWKRLPAQKRGNYFGGRPFGGTYTTSSGGWGGGGGGFGGGGFGGGGGGGGGAGGGF